MQAPEWFAGVMARLMAAYPSWPCSARTVQVFWDVLNDLPQRDLERAAIEHVAGETSWPIAARLRTLAKASDANVMTASQAWDEMYRNRHAHTPNPKWSCEAVELAAQAINWNEPSWLTEQIPTLRAQFERYYNAAAKRTERRIEHADALTLMERSVAKDAKQVYGQAYLKGEAADEEYDRKRLAYIKPDNVDPLQIDDAEVPW